MPTLPGCGLPWARPGPSPRAERKDAHGRSAAIAVPAAAPLVRQARFGGGAQDDWRNRLLPGRIHARELLPAPGSLLADLAEGSHELAIRPWHWINLLAHACGNFGLRAFFVLGPVIALRSLGGAASWGLISALWGAGAIAAGVVVLRIKPRRPLIVADLLATGLAVPLLAMGLPRSVAVIAAANASFGFELIVSNTLCIQSLIRTRCAHGSTPTTCSSPVSCQRSASWSRAAGFVTGLHPRRWSARRCSARFRTPSSCSCWASGACAGLRPERSSPRNA